MQLTVNKCKISTWLCALLALLAVAGLAAGCLKTEPPERLPVQILAINDFHGQVIPGKKVQDRPVGSAPVLAAYLRKAQKDFAG